MRADQTDACHHRFLEPGVLLVALELVRIRRHSGELQDIHTGHLRVHLLERTRLHQRVDAFPGPDREMMGAPGTYLEVLVEFLVIDHGRALGALGPKAFGDFLSACFGCSEFGFPDETAAGDWAGPLGRVFAFDPNRLLGNERCRHMQNSRFSHLPRATVHTHTSAAPAASSTLAQAFAVAPVVNTSSTSTIRRRQTGDSGRSANARRMFAVR